MKYPWPGNIRELRNMIERALLLSQGEPLAISHFPGLENVPQLEQQQHVTSATWNLDEIEKHHIIQALKHFNGDKYEASSALGISLSSLYRKVDKIQQQTPV
jgi:DNA-binding NtrC family response regulator